MKRILIAIGCDSYEALGNLSGAVNDATQFHRSLTTGDTPFYDPSNSLLLKSPSLAQLQTAVSAMKMSSGEVETLTFYFAGHGATRSGSFWMCTRDAVPEMLSPSAYSLSQLFLLIQELRPQQANIVIDACESGGVLSDIRASLRATDFGDALTTGINIFASCAKNQYALETGGAGVFTNSLIKCIDGTTYVEDSSPTMSLSQIASKLSDHSLGIQDPVFWGLNISRVASLCWNPHFSTDGTMREAIAAQPTVKSSPKITKAIWHAYQEVDERWNAASFRDLLVTIVEDPDLGNPARIEIIRQVSAALVLRAQNSPDPFREIEVQATCLSALLQFCDNDQIASHVISECEHISQKILHVLSRISLRLGEDRYSLLGRSAHPELFFLPLRLSKIAGWAGVCLHIAGSQNLSLDTAPLRELFQVVIDFYALSFSAVSDSQAPYAAAMVSGFMRTGLTDQAETLIGLLFHSFCEAGGNIAATSVQPDQIVNYLLSRATRNFESSAKAIARPTELSTVLFLSAQMLSIEDEFDEAFEDLDRHSINAFVPSTYRDYGRDRIQKGQNYTFKIGYEIWTCEEFLTYWKKISKPSPENSAVDFLSVLSSLLYPDRTCWHLLDSRAN